MKVMGLNSFDLKEVKEDDKGCADCFKLSFHNWLKRRLRTYRILKLAILLLPTRPVTFPYLLLGQQQSAVKWFVENNAVMFSL